MRGRVLLYICLGVNLLFAVMIYRLGRATAALDAAASAGAPNQRLLQKTVKTNVVVRRLPIRWADLESTDFKTYIQNLRSIGCPESTIRDIIVAEVNDYFKTRQQTEIMTSEQQWWRLEPDMDLVQASFAKFRELEKEKEFLLDELLGPGWRPQAEQPPMPGSLKLDGPILGTLTKEKQAEVAAIQVRAQERAQLYEKSLAGKPLDPLQLARLREETRQELAAILNPEQLEEYLLRYSQTASTLRVAVNGMNLGPEEFRKIFRAVDPYQRELELLQGDGAAVQKRKAALEEMKNRAIEQALGKDKFTTYALNQNPLFVSARDQVEQQGALPEKVIPIYEINRAAQAEVQRLMNDKTLSEEDRQRAIELVQSQQEQSIKQLLAK